MDVLSKEYLTWLGEATKGRKKVYCIPGMSEDKNVQLLERLFEKIDEYVRVNYYFNIDEYGNNYTFIDDNGLKYTISKIYGPDIVYTLVRDPNKTRFVNISDVRQRTVHGRENMEVLYRMKTISLYLKELDKMGVPIDMVEGSINSEIRLIRHKKRTTK